MEFKHKGISLISDDQIAQNAEKLSDYVMHLRKVSSDGKYDSPESSINLPADADILGKVEKLANEKKSDKLKYVLVIGIGGSNLGAMAVYDAIYGKIDAFKKDRFPKIIFIDTVAPNLLSNAKKIIKDEINNPDEILVNLISKSGTTTEAIANFEVIYKLISDKFSESDISSRIVITTGLNSRLREMAEKNDFTILDIPDNVGGRYSVFSSVGLFPLALSGIDIGKLLEGAHDMTDKCTSNEISENPALASAILAFRHNLKGASISNSFFFNPDLSSVGMWYRQLMGESIGKEKDLDGNVVHSGITPIVSVGSTDLHSMAQLYFGGRKDKLTTFIYSPQPEKEKIPENLVFPGLVAGIKGKDLAQIMDAIYEGVKKAYEKNKLPFVEVILPEISEYELGQYLQFKMVEMMYLAKLLNVNAFNQPSVESYKEETQNILS